MNTHKLHTHQLRTDGQGGAYGTRKDQGGPELRINVNTIHESGPYTLDPLHGHYKGIQNFLVQQGILQVEINKVLVDISPGELCEIQPNTLYRIVGVKESPCSYITICTTNDTDDRFESF